MTDLARVTIDMNQELFEDLTQRAEARGVTVTELIRQGVSLDKFVHEAIDALDVSVVIDRPDPEALPRMGVLDAGWRIVRFDPNTVEQGPLIITDEWTPQ